MAKLLDLTGKRFHMLTAVCAERDGKRTYWHCVCDCGTACRVETNNLRRPDRKPSCGCYAKKAVGQANSTHRMTGTRVYRSWASMKCRCLNPTDGAYPKYGGRGISVCEQWLVFENFLSDMGEPPTPKHTLDRIDVNGNYEPGNCRWATPTQQARNTRRNVVYNFLGQMMTAPEISDKTGVPLVTIRKRLASGHPIEVAASKTNLRYGSVIQSLKD